jgi:hypothetical protein
MEMKLAMAARAESNQIFCSIAERSARTNMVHLKAFRASAILASPAISLQHFVTKLAIGIRVQP